MSLKFICNSKKFLTAIKPSHILLTCLKQVMAGTLNSHLIMGFQCLNIWLTVVRAHKGEREEHFNVCIIPAHSYALCDSRPSMHPAHALFYHM